MAQESISIYNTPYLMILIQVGNNQFYNPWHIMVLMVLILYYGLVAMNRSKTWFLLYDYNQSKSLSDLKYSHPTK